MASIWDYLKKSILLSSFICLQIKQLSKVNLFVCLCYVLCSIGINQLAMLLNNLEAKAEGYYCLIVNYNKYLSIS